MTTNMHDRTYVRLGSKLKKAHMHVCCVVARCGLLAAPAANTLLHAGKHCICTSELAPVGW